ncbi:hypothetical protein SB78_01525 [Rickettsia asembonensis]|uniref:Uncharacterized protein n=2 Tax=Rickettsia asembonensis TaxID=1068590 RepID=A0A0C2MPL7_9RICK|nr:hypothetical protein SB78_01525 [Rickettsia asembonensis]
MPSGNSSITSTFLSFTKDGVLTICCVIFAILAILKIQEYCKNSKKTLDQDNDNTYMPMELLSKKENKFIEHQDNIYQYNPDKDIYEKYSTTILGSTSEV